VVRKLTCAPGWAEEVVIDKSLPGYSVLLRPERKPIRFQQYSIGGRTRRVYLPEGGAQARPAAEEIRAQVKLGRDPQAEKAKRKADAAVTMGSLLPQFLARQRALLRPGSMRGQTRHLEKHCRPLHSLSIQDVNDLRRIAALLAEITTTSGPREAVHVRSSLAKFLDWTASEGVLDGINVVHSTNKPVTNWARSRTPTLNELAAIYRTVGDSQLGQITKLLILCGARRSEIGHLRWDEVSLEDALITLPGSRTKNGHEHLIPLSAPALEILKQRRLQTAEDTVFGRSKIGFQDWNRGKAALDAQLAAAGVELPPWVFHDTRRGFSTYMNENGIAPPHVVERLLGHTVPGVAGIYDKSRMTAERRRALEQWADTLMAEVEGKTQQARVVPMRKRRT
jgi:integrase